MSVGHWVWSFAHAIPVAMRRVIFWLGVIMGVIILIKPFSGPSPERELRYSELLQQIRKGNVRTAEFSTAKDTVELDGALSNPQEQFRVRLESKEVRDLTAHLRQAGIPATSGEILEPGTFGYDAMFGIRIVFFPAFFWVVRWQIHRLQQKSREFETPGAQ